MKLAALALTLLAGCAAYQDRQPAAVEPTSSIHYVIHGDTQCPFDVRADTEASARDWGTVSHGHIDYRLVWDLSAANVLELRDDPILVCRKTMWLGGPLCGMTTGTIVELSLASYCHPRADSLHELGHLAGIHDHLPPGAVMSSTDNVSRLTAADVRACAALGLCPRPGARDVTTVTMTVDPSIPPGDVDYPEWPHE